MPSTEGEGAGPLDPVAKVRHLRESCDGLTSSAQLEETHHDPTADYCPVYPVG